MEMKGTNGNDLGTVGNKGMQYSADQVTILEQLFSESDEIPSETQRLAMVHDNPALSKLNSEQIHVWFEIRKQGKGDLMLQLVDEKMAATNRLLMLENKMAAANRLLMLENKYLKDKVQFLIQKNNCIRKLQKYASLDHLLATELPRSVFKNVKRTAHFKLLPLVCEYHRYEVQQLNMEDEYSTKLLQGV